jgi:D-alanyl-D-alanine carboxypeptidase
MAAPDRLRSLRWALASTLIACVAAAGPAGPAGPAQASPAAPPAVEQALDRLVGVPGAMVLQRAGGRQCHATAGAADLKTQEPIGPRDRFRIGSITKSYVRRGPAARRRAAPEA